MIQSMSWDSVQKKMKRLQRKNEAKNGKMSDIADILTPFGKLAEMEQFRLFRELQKEEQISDKKDKKDNEEITDKEIALKIYNVSITYQTDDDMDKHYMFEYLLNAVDKDKERDLLFKNVRMILQSNLPQKDIPTQIFKSVKNMIIMDPNFTAYSNKMKQNMNK